MKKILSNKNSMLYKVFIIFSVLICIFLPSFVNHMMSTSGVYPKSEAESINIPMEIANKIAIFIWPILFAYIVLLVKLICTKINKRKVYYPLSMFTLTVIFYQLGMIYWSYLLIWYLVLFFPFLLILFIVLCVIGCKADKVL